MKKTSKKDTELPSYIEKNKVFLSWSKGKSLEIALLLKDELEIVFQDIEIWISTEMGQGKYEHKKITENAAGAQFCICILDHDNYMNPWPIFEAGMFYGYPSKEIFVMLCGSLDRQHLTNRGHPIEGNFCILSSEEKASKYISSMVDSLNKQFFQIEERKIERSKSALSTRLVELHDKIYNIGEDSDINADDAFIDTLSNI